MADRTRQGDLRAYSPSRIPQPRDEDGGGVTEQHPDYVKYSSIWTKCRDVILGEDAVKEAGIKYLPTMAGMTQDEYEAYKNRAMFYGATGRTIAGLLGAIFRKDPVLEAPDKIHEWAKNITQDGIDLLNFAQDIVSEQLAIGRVGILVDMPPDGGVPYIRLYTAEAITNWRQIIRNGIPFLDQVVVREVLARPALDGFGSDFYVQYRVLEIEAETGIYVQRIFEFDDITGEDVDKNPGRFVEKERIYPKRFGQNLDFIPFVFINDKDINPSVKKPPLLDLINVNLSHYRSSADLEHGRHFTALPTPVVSGVDEPEDKNDASQALRIGSGTAWLLPMGAQARMLEFNGQGLKHLENALNEKAEIMVNLGARMLETNKRAAETAEALRLRQSGDQSMLQVLSTTASAGITRALRWAAWWGDIVKDWDDASVNYTLNEDFFESRMDAMELRGLIEAWQKRAISFKDLFAMLVRGEIISPERNIEAVRKDILEDLEIESQIAAKKAEEQATVLSITGPAEQKFAPKPAGPEKRPGSKE